MYVLVPLLTLLLLFTGVNMNKINEVVVSVMRGVHHKYSVGGVKTGQTRTSSSC